jgi:hypothetical protein
MAKRPSEPKLCSWAIYRLRGTPAQYLSYVDAADEAEALRNAIR